MQSCRQRPYVTLVGHYSRPDIFRLLVNGADALSRLADDSEDRVSSDEMAGPVDVIGNFASRLK